MRIFSGHRKKVEAKRRFGSLEFRNKIKEASSYKRAYIKEGNGKALTYAKFLTVAIFGLAFYFLVISDSLLVKEVSIQGNSQVSTEQIEDVLNANANSRLLLIKKNHFLLMSQGRINKLLTKSLPTIKEVTKSDRGWPDKISIELVEHTPGFVIESNGNYFLVDDEGIVVEQIPDPKNFLVVNDQLTESFASGDRLSNQKFVPFILSMKKTWSSKISTPIATVKFPGKSSTEVQFITNTGWAVLFDTSRSVTVQLSDLSIILSKQITPGDLQNLAYIDLRLSKWAYYCFKQSPCEQQPRPTEAGATTTNE